MLLSDLQNATGPAIALWPRGTTPLYDPQIPDQREPALFPYLLPDAPEAGCVIVLSGGGYSQTVAHEAEPIAQRFNELGLHAFVLDYRYFPYLYPCCLLDVKRAVRMVRFHGRAWGVNPERIAVCGFSAGGHLATVLLTHYDGGDPAAADPVQRVSCRPDAVLPCYTPSDYYAYRPARGIPNLLGPDATLEQIREMTARLNLLPDTPPVFIMHTAQDEKVPVGHAFALADALCARGFVCALHIYPFGRHGMGTGLRPGQENFQGQHWMQDAARFLAELGF